MEALPTCCHRSTLWASRWAPGIYNHHKHANTQTMMFNSTMSPPWSEATRTICRPVWSRNCIRWCSYVGTEQCCSHLKLSKLCFTTPPTTLDIVKEALGLLLCKLLHKVTKTKLQEHIHDHQLRADCTFLITLCCTRLERSCHCQRSMINKTQRLPHKKIVQLFSLQRYPYTMWIGLTRQCKGM